MDVFLGNERPVKRCYKCADSVVSILNIVYNACNSTIILWNKFQIYVYEDLELNFGSKVIVPEFQIFDLILSNNHIVCLDYAGNVHTTSLKFKNAATQKRFKGSFQLRESGIIACSLFTEDYTICLKFESNSYFLCVYKINSELKLEKRALITCQLSPLQKNNTNYILKSYPILETHIESLKTKFNIPDMDLKRKNNLILISLDRYNVYACLFNTQSAKEEITAVKLYTCPSLISDIDIIDIGDINILIGLQTGTFIIVNFKDTCPKIIHVNIAIHKFMGSKDYVIYTDGLTMWKADSILSNENKFTQLFVKKVNDFIKFADQVVCVTYDNLIYTFSLEDEEAYINPKSAPDYCPVDKIFQNSQYINNILALLKDNERLIKNQKKERDYIMALSVCGRQDVMDKVINQNVIVYESYEHAIAAHSDIMLTNKIHEYFDADSYYFFINITINKEQRLGDLISKDVGDVRLHVTFNSENQIAKTNTVDIANNVATMNILIPLKTKFINLDEMKIDLKIVTCVPGVYSAKQKIWSVLYRKPVILNSEYFIKLGLNSVNKIVHLKPSNLSLDELILEAAKHHYETVIDFTNEEPRIRIWNMYVRLPIGYQNVLKNENTKQKFTSKKAIYFLEQFMADDFLQSKSSINLTICNDQVKIETDNDGFSTPCLKISSRNVKIAFDMRNYLANLIYSIFDDFGPGKQFISDSFYITVENLQKSLKELISTGLEEDILHLIDEFERKVIGSLPV